MTGGEQLFLWVVVAVAGCATVVSVVEDITSAIKAKYQPKQDTKKQDEDSL